MYRIFIYLFVECLISMGWYFLNYCLLRIVPFIYFFPKSINLKKKKTKQFIFYIHRAYSVALTDLYRPW
jgi:hypothetical protein